MILSHKHRFIFIKTNKTAGTSVEIALSKYCGPDDIITPISDVDEQMRIELGYPGAQNYLSKATGDPVFYNHMSGAEVRSQVGEEIWSNYFKFCIERNPWDRVISLYHWRQFNGQDVGLSLGDFIETDHVQKLKRWGFNLYAQDKKILVNKIIRYENLQEEIAGLAKRLGLGGSIELPRAKSHARKDRRHYSEVLNKKQQLRIAKIFGNEILLMKYKF